MIQYFEIPSVDEAVKKNMFDAIIARVLLESGISDSEVVYKADDFNSVRQPNSQLGQTTDISFGQSEKVYIEITEEPDESERVSRGVGLDRHLPFFANRKYGIYLTPITRRYDVEIELSRNSASKDRLQRWCNRLNSMLDMGRYSLMTEGEFFYVVPPNALGLLRDCYDTLTKRKKIYDSLAAFLTDGFKDNIFTISNVAGGNKSLAVRHKPTRVEVVYDIQGPKLDKKELGYEAGLSIRFSYEKPVEVLARHPTILNQSIMPEKWLPDINPPYLGDEYNVPRSQIQQGLDDVANYIEDMIGLPWLESGEDSFGGITIPDNNNNSPVIGSDVIFEDDNLVNPDVININKLPVTFNKIVIDYINCCIAKDPYGRNCIIKMMFFKDGIYLGPTAGTWDFDGWWTYKGEIEITSRYYYCITIINNWALVTNDMVECLRKHPAFVKLIFEWFKKDKELVVDITKPLPMPDLEEVTDALTRNPREGLGYMLTVMNSTILTFPPRNR